jgi:hypothetical protein
VKDCDFIPADYHATRTMRAAIRLRAGCVSAMVAIMVLWVAAHHHRLSTVKAMMPEITRQQEQLSMDSAKKASMELERERLKDRRRLLTELEAGVSLVPVLSEISRRMPETIVLIELSASSPSVSRFSVEEQAPGKPQEPSAPGAKPATPTPPQEDQDLTATLTMMGIAVDNADVARFAAALEGSPLFDRIQPEAKGSTVWSGRRAQLFELTCGLVRQQEDKP